MKKCKSVIPGTIRQIYYYNLYNHNSVTQKVYILSSFLGRTQYGDRCYSFFCYNITNNTTCIINGSFRFKREKYEKKEKTR